MGPQAGGKVLTLQAIPAWGEDDYGNDHLGRIGGFSLPAGVTVNTRERKKLERICRYISRPAQRLKRVFNQAAQAEPPRY